METVVYEDEIQCLEGIRRGEERAFTKLFDRYWQDLYTLAYRRLNNGDEAGDMVQEIFADIWQRRNDLYIHTSFWAYLQKALKYRIIRAGSRADLHHKAMEYLMSRMELMENTILEQIAAGEIKKTIADVVHTFPDNMQKVFVLRTENYTVEEIATAMGLAVQTVKNNQTEALRRLKLALAKQQAPIDKSLYLLLLLFIES